ncbi:MAG: hypothetical protein HY235_14725 [Acidobacteria bacterium]|nr:hypothetical protein [Acidobacteriota bacterium]
MTLCIFLLMLIGIADFAQFLFIHSALTERTRSAVRYGVTTSPIDTTRIRNMVLYGNPNGTNGVSAAPAGFNLTPSNVEVNELDAGTEDHRLQVRIINYRYTILSPLIFGTYSAPPISAGLPLGVNN